MFKGSRYAEQIGNVFIPKVATFLLEQKASNLGDRRLYIHWFGAV
jgi:hypothetical protein